MNSLIKFGRINVVCFQTKGHFVAYLERDDLMVGVLKAKANLLSQFMRGGNCDIATRHNDSTQCWPQQPNNMSSQSCLSRTIPPQDCDQLAFMDRKVNSF